MEFLVRQAIRRYLKRHYRREMRSIIARAERIRPKLAKRAPYIGGKKNALANNLDMFILFLSYYEASGHRMAGDAIDEIIDDIYRHLRFLDIFMDINRRPFLILLRNCLYKSYLRYAEKVRQKQSKGEWLASWGMSVDPDKTDEGFAFTLIGCPIAEYGKKYGYTELIPHMCALDHAYAKLLHAKLIRTHTVALGADSCDYWYVPDKSRTARNFKGKIV
ncbi:MAG: L-2-amino-thiazoline-4-carboxylic acid hydrolase [Oscillospiraceae bacterium]|nr:L-2-amino-thiazoline-4-carboxylic acid hydrolase [Oscillospiraceae bacterium]